MKKVIIIGASSGIGKTLAEHYASGGCQVAVAARREECLREIQAKFPGQVQYCVMDVSDQGASGLFRSMISNLGGVDLVIYCSGAGKSSSDLDFAIEKQTVDVNVRGFLNIIVPAFNHFASLNCRPQIRPQIVTISSVASIRGLSPTPSYSATKRFQTIYFEALEQKAYKMGLDITFTAIMPGFIATDFIHRCHPFTMELPYASKFIIKAIEKRRRRAVIDWKWSLIATFMKLVPSSIWRRIKL